jgi:hypothetical protein
MNDSPALPQPSPAPVPGSRPDKQLDFLYIETTGEMTPLEHLNWASKSYRAALKAGALSPPKSGLLGTTGWLLRTPTGQSFYGLQVGGDKEAWLAALRYCAQSERRSAGQIIGYRRIPARFVLDDGQMFNLEQCDCTKM